MIKKKLQLEGLHCTSCAMLIEGELEDINVSCKCSYATQTAEVEFDDNKVSHEQVREAIEKLGYKVIDR
jgi:copper chaperone CopZ